MQSSQLPKGLPPLPLREAAPYSMKAPIEINGTAGRIRLFFLTYQGKKKKGGGGGRKKKKTEGGICLFM